jgi:hypothetical protein
MSSAHILFQIERNDESHGWALLSLGNEDIQYLRQCLALCPSDQPDVLCVEVNYRGPKFRILDIHERDLPECSGALSIQEGEEKAAMLNDPEPSVEVEQASDALLLSLPTFEGTACKLDVTNGYLGWNVWDPRDAYDERLGYVEMPASLLQRALQSLQSSAASD